MLVDIQDDAGREMAGRLGDAATYVHGDVSVEDDVAAAVDAAVERYGRLDCVVNNAGILGALGPIAEIDGAAWRRTIAVLLDSVFYGTKHAARVMIEAGNGGSIVNIASTAGVRAGLGPARVHGGQARRRRAHPVRGTRARPPRHPRQRHRPGRHGDQPHRLRDDR